jgi:maleamate amidohydrolase
VSSGAKTDRMKLTQFYERRGFARRLGFGVSPAIVVIDFIHAFTDASYDLGSDLDKEVAATSRLLQCARSFNIDVIFTTTAYHEGDREARFFHAKVPALRDLRLGSRAVEVDPRLGPLVSETLLVKKFASAFFGTALHSQLTASGIDTLLITGCTTSGCVRATAVDALQYGFRPVVILECVGDRAKAPHDANLFDIESKYGDVVRLDEALAYLRNVANGHSVASRVPTQCVDRVLDKLSSEGSN